MPRKKSTAIQVRKNPLEAADELSMPLLGCSEEQDVLVVDETVVIRISNGLNSLFPLEYKFVKGTYISNDVLKTAVLSNKKIKYHYEQLCLSPNLKK